MFIDITADHSPWNEKIIRASGHDMTAAFEMRPEYIRSLLGSLQMLDHPIYMERRLHGAYPNQEEVQRLMGDPSLSLMTEEVIGANGLFMAVVANVYIGDPSSLWSLMVAKIR